MNTDYPGGQIPGGVCSGLGFTTDTSATNILCGSGRLGVDLMQLIIAPTWSIKYNETQSFGVSPLIGYQRFKADGLHGFTNFSSDTNNLTNNGHDTSTGYGVRIGWMGKMSDTVTLGAAYSSKMDMSKLDKYKGLFAEQGDFDLPSNYNLGIAIKANPKTTVAVDYQKINYTDAKSVSNPSTNGGATMANTLGGSDGRGFGWGDIGVWKIGVEYQYSSKLTLRGGYDKSENPITPRDVTFNIIAPAVVQDHYTFGFTYLMDKDSEMTMAFSHVPEKKLSGESLYVTWLGAAGGGTEEIKMHQNSVGVAWSKKW